MKQWLINYKYLVCLLSFFLISIILYGNLINNKFSIIDDHQIASFMGSDESFEISEIKKNLNYKEITGKTDRFRPTFHIAYLFEISLFDANTSYYYILRIIIFALFLFSTFYLINQFNNLLISSLLLFLIILQGFWFDILSRIILSEIHSIAGLIIFIPSSIIIYKYLFKLEYSLNDLSIYIISFLYLASGIYVAGSKENFIFIAIIPLIYLYKQINQKEFKFILFMSNIFLLLFCTLVLFFILKYYLSTDKIISGAVSFDTIKTIENFFKTYVFSVYFLFYLLVNIIIKKLYNDKNNSHKVKKIFKNISFLNIILVIIVITQLVYYSLNRFPTDTRYDFPIYYCILLFTAFIIPSYNNIIGIYNPSKYKLLIKQLPTIILLIAITFNNPIINIRNNIQDTNNRVKSNQEFHLFLDNIKNISAANKKNIIIINSFNVWDYELISSFFKYLKFYGVKNKIILNLNYSEDDYSTPVEKLFVRRLESIKNGDKTNIEWAYQNYDIEWGFDVISNHNFIKDCVSINLRSKNKLINCSSNLEYIFKR